MQRAMRNPSPLGPSLLAPAPLARLPRRIAPRVARISPRMRRHGHAMGRVLLEAILLAGAAGFLAAGTFLLR